MILNRYQRTALDGLAKALVVVVLVAFIWLLSSCSKKTVPQSTAIVLDNAAVRTELPGTYCGDTAYAQVNSAWLKGYYAEFRQAIFDQGVTKFDARFDCNHFASFYAALAQTKFYAANFQSWTKAESLAVGTFWYQSPRGNHAVVFALTERGLVFVEPQTGAEVTLTPAERQSAFLVTI